MPMKLLDKPDIDREALSARLASALNERDRGLLTQMEYEDRLAEVALSLGRHTVIEENAMRAGGTRFIVRNSLVGAAMESFEYPE